MSFVDSSKILNRPLPPLPSAASGAVRQLAGTNSVKQQLRRPWCLSWLVKSPRKLKTEDNILIVAVQGATVVQFNSKRHTLLCQPM